MSLTQIYITKYKITDENNVQEMLKKTLDLYAEFLTTIAAMSTTKKIALRTQIHLSDFSYTPKTPAQKAGIIIIEESPKKPRKKYTESDDGAASLSINPKKSKAPLNLEM